MKTQKDSENHKVKLEVDNNTIARFWLILLGILVAISLLFWSRSALVLFGASLFLAVSINPVIDRLSKKKIFKGKRVWPVLIAYFGVIVVLLVAAWLLVPALIEQISKIIKNAPEIINNLFDTVSHSKLFEKMDTETVRNSLVSAVNSGSQNWVSAIGGKVFNGIGSAASSVISIVLTVAIAVMLSIDLPNIKNYIFSFYRDKKLREHHENLLHRMYSVIVGFVSGQVMVALINGLIASVVIFILSFIFSIPQGMIALFGITLFLSSTIPMFGTTIGLIITVLFMVIYSWQAALIFTIYYLIYQQIEGNIIGPMIQSKRVDMSTLLILASITLGTFMFGLLGGIIAIPIAGCIKILVEDFIINRRH